MFSAHRKKALAAAITATCLTGLAGECAAQALTISLNELDAKHSFSIVGGQPVELLGVSVGGRGDINGDGFDDLLVGARQSTPSEYGRRDPGAAYVVFGGRGALSTPVSAADLDGSDGFRADGIDGADYTGFSVSVAGDVNGDGLDDFIVGAPGPFRPYGDTRPGKAFVVFGSSSGFNSTLDLASLTGADGFRIVSEGERDRAGISVSSAGDVNGDGFDDLVVGVPLASPGDRSSAGSAFVIFGKASAFSSTVALSDLSAVDGFRIDGEAAEDALGFGVSNAGDLNGDGLDDLIMGAPGANASGSAYVLFGRSGAFPHPFDLSTLDGVTGFRIDGDVSGGFFGGFVSRVGDFNGDGLDDILVGEKYSNESTQPGVGDAYLWFGRSGNIPALFSASSLAGSVGLRLDGRAASGVRRGLGSSAGDLNGDGFDDVIVGSTVDNISFGRAYVVLGRPDEAVSLSLPDLSGRDGWRFEDFVNPSVGYSVASAGDINGDGVDDVAIGLPAAEVANIGEGKVVVVYGARPSIFRDGAEAENIVTTLPRVKVRPRTAGSSVHWQTGARCNCDNDSFDFNVKLVAGEIIFDWPAASASEGGVLIGGSYAVLQSGATIGPASTFSTSAAASATVDWRAGADGYLGFRFVNSNSGAINYGYARIRSTAPTGFPVEIVSVGYNLTGLPVSVPQN